MKGAIGSKEHEVSVPSVSEIRNILKTHPLLSYKGAVKAAYVIGSFAAGSSGAHSDFDVLLVIPKRKGCTAQEFEEKSRSKIRSYFMKNKIFGKADHLHPQWMGRRMDVYFAYESPSRDDSRPFVKLA